MKLDQWVEDNPDRARGLAAALRTHPKSIIKYCKGSRLPVKPVMRRLYVFTGGEVTPNDFYDLPPLRNGAAKRKAAA